MSIWDGRTVARRGEDALPAWKRQISVSDPLLPPCIGQLAADPAMRGRMFKATRNVCRAARLARTLADAAAAPRTAVTRCRRASAGTAPRRTRPSTTGNPPGRRHRSPESLVSGN
jgi:hypothetical protein